MWAGLLTTQSCAERSEGGCQRTRGSVPVQVDVVAATCLAPIVTMWDWPHSGGWMRQVDLPAALLACIPQAGQGEPPASSGNSSSLRWK